MMRAVAVLLVAITACAADTNDEEITRLLGWYRTAHGGGRIESDAGLVYKAYDATNAICQYGFDHHKGTEAEIGSITYEFGSCDPVENQKKALKKFYGECPNYNYQDGGGNFGDYGHFSQVVWKSSTKYGMWAQQCDIPGVDCAQWGGCCAIVLKSDGNFNVAGDYGRNIDNVGVCADVDQPWGKRRRRRR